MYKIFILTFMLSGIAYANSEIAAKYSPIIYQGIGSNPEADIFTKVDFDNDWNPDNNWDNLPLFNKPPSVYWNVIESDDHYFVTYAFYYPRDYADWCFWIHCHENDFEGMRVTVRKPDKVIKLEGLAHNFRSEVINPEKIEVTIEKEGHGVHPYSLRKPDVRFKKYLPQDYQLIPLAELWQKKSTSLFTGNFTYGGKTYPANFGGKKWILFGLGAAKPAWSWEVWRSEIEKGQWFLDPLKGSSEKYIKHLSDDMISENNQDRDKR